MSDLTNTYPSPLTGSLKAKSKLASAASREADTPLTQTLGFLLVAAQCAVILFLAQRFRLEDDRFLLVVRAALGGFVVHHFLPSRWRLPFFVALSMGTLLYYLGLRQARWDLAQALPRMGLLVGIGLVLIGICHLPLRYGVRVTLLLAVGGVLAVFRAGWITVVHLNAIWPILGAMFMFRLMIYLYDREHEKQHGSIWEVLAYFFLFPSVWVFLFPTIDYKTFRRNYFNDRAVAIYQKGLGWVMRGIAQLLIWRLFYYDVYLDPSRITSGADLARYMVANVCLYFRVSGQFHIIIGLLHLFGFNLPETYRRFFLAASFSDYWRRVSIYWKDFVMKIFYYPAVVRLKKWGPRGSVGGAVAFSFAVTWLLHSYQWFWLRGDFPLQPKDVLFWGLLGVLVTTNSIRELDKGRIRTLGQGTQQWKQTAMVGLNTASTFGLLMLFWSIWSADSITQWLGLWKYADGQFVLYSLLAVAAIGVAAVVLESPSSRWRAKEPSTKDIPSLPWRRAALVCFVPAALLVGATSRFVHYPPQVKLVRDDLFRNTPNKSDEEYMVRGYYEGLTDASRFGVTGASTAPADWIRLGDSTATRPVSDLRTTEFVPSKETIVNGVPVRINHWGMRDRDYTLEKPPGTYRIALLGSSIVMGWMVPQEQIFESLLEDRLNREHSGRRYEILNFALNRYSPLSQIDVLKKQALQFKPDAIFFVSHRVDPRRCGRVFATSVRMGAPVEHPFLRDVAAKAGLTPKTPNAWDDRILSPHWLDLTAWGYKEIARLSKEAGATPYMIYLPSIIPIEDPTFDGKLLQFASDAGFTTIPLLGLYDKYSRQEIVVAPWDDHPNVKGHQLVADRLYEALSGLAGPVRIF